MHGIEKECRQNQTNVSERKRKRDLQLDNERAEETSLSVDGIALEKFAGISVLPSQSAYTLGSSVTYSSEAAFQPQTHRIFLQSSCFIVANPKNLSSHPSILRGVPSTTFH
jgi:hypothetical protein